MLPVHDKITRVICHRLRSRPSDAISALTAFKLLVSQLQSQPPVKPLAQPSTFGCVLLYIPVPHFVCATLREFLPFLKARVPCHKACKQLVQRIPAHFVMMEVHVVTLDTSAIEDLEQVSIVPPYQGHLLT